MTGLTSIRWVVRWTSVGAPSAVSLQHERVAAVIVSAMISFHAKAFLFVVRALWTVRRQVRVDIVPGRRALPPLIGGRRASRPSVRRVTSPPGVSGATRARTGESPGWRASSEASRRSGSHSASVVASASFQFLSKVFDWRFFRPDWSRAIHHRLLLARHFLLDLFLDYGLGPGHARILRRGL